jgi:hypothetical protein
MGPAASRSPTLLAALGAIGLAVLLTWPVLLHPVDRLLGHPGNDTWNHAWGYWWVADELRQGRWPAHTDLLAFPDGGTLYFIDTVQAVAVAPLTLTLGPAFAFNVVMMSGVAFSAFAAWLLARRVSGDDLTAALAALIYGASPQLLGQAYNGISETVCAGWMPLTLWALVRVIDRPSLKRGALLGLAAAACVLTSWYYGLLTAIAGVVLLLWTLAQQTEVVSARRWLFALGGGGLLAGALVGPMLLGFRASLEADDALVTRDPDFVWGSLLNHNMTDVYALLIPGKTPRPDLFTLYGEELVIIIYLGWIALGLSAAALLATRRGRENQPWLWIGGMFFLFSLGPYLHAGGRYVELAGHRIPLPFLLLFEGLPLFDRISHPFRFVTGVMLCLGLLAAQGARHLLRGQSPQRRGLVILALCLAVLVEVRLGSPATLPVPAGDAHIPQAYLEMADDPTPGAVLDLPLTIPNLERAVYSWYQTAHQRPAPWGLNDPMPAALLRNRLTTTLIRMEASRARTLPARLPELDIVVSARALARQGYRYLVVHERLYPAWKLEQLLAVLDGAIGGARPWPEDGLRVYTLTAPGAGGAP